MDETRLLRALTHAPIFLLLLDPEDGRIRWWNRPAYGLSLAEVIGTNSDDFALTPADRDLWQAARGQARDLNRVTTYEVRVRVPAPPGWARIWGQIAPTPEGLLVASHDVTLGGHLERASRFLFTPLSRAAVLFLRDHGPAKGAVIGRELCELDSNGKNASAVLRACLAGLCERRVLHHDAQGYSLTDDFRALAQDLF